MTEPRSRRDEIMDAVRRDFKRRRRERAVIAVAGLLLAGLLFLVFQFSHLAGEGSLIEPLVIYFFSVAIWALILILILVLVFLIVRNLVKYVVERRRYRLRFRLVMAFVALTVLPGGVLFILSSYILNTSIESLYSPHIQKVVGRAKEVVQSNIRISDAAREIIEGKYEADGEDSVHFARELSRSVLEQGWVTVLDPGPETGPPPETGPRPVVEQLERFLDLKRQEYNLALVAVFDRTGKIVVRSQAEGIEFPEIPTTAIEATLAGSQGFNPPESSGAGAVIFAFYPVPRRPAIGSEEPEIVGGIVAARYITWVPQHEWGELSGAVEAKEQIEDFELLSRLELPIRAFYYLLLIVVTLIVLFLAVWFGFYMAKGITEPIQLLAEGTEMVASGRLDYKIDMAAEGDDEISILVRSFNKMTQDLSLSRLNLDQAYQSLRETNLELDQRRSYMETVLAQVTTGVISVDHDENVSTINQAALRMLGQKDRAQVLGRPLTHLLRPEELETYHALVAELQETGTEAAVARRQLTVYRDENRFVVLISASPLWDERGEELGMLLMVEDLTDLVRAHRAMAWREVARRIAHEIKNPLTPIQLAAQRLERRYADTLAGEEAEVFRQSIRTIIAQVEQLKHLVNEFSLFARLPATNPRPQNLPAVIDEVILLYRDAHPQIQFEVIGGSGLPLIEIDQEQMKRVLVNLLDNAVASIEGPGRVEVEMIHLEALQTVRIEIRDTGHGIPAYVRERIFEPYYSTKHGGSGLGLTIVQRIIADHNGYIRILPNLPQGTVIVIELPLVSSDHEIAARGGAGRM